MSEEIKIAETPIVGGDPLGAPQKTAYGKFADAESLFKAYKALEAEFTKRCQELKALEHGLRVSEEELLALKTRLETVLDDEDFLDKAALDGRVQERVIRTYLTARTGLPCTPLLRTGFGFAAGTAVRKPKTLEEARTLAEELLR